MRICKVQSFSARGPNGVAQVGLWTQIEIYGHLKKTFREIFENMRICKVPSFSARGPNGVAQICLWTQIEIYEHLEKKNLSRHI